MFIRKGVQLVAAAVKIIAKAFAEKCVPRTPRTIIFAATVWAVKAGKMP